MSHAFPSPPVRSCRPCPWFAAFLVSIAALFALLPNRPARAIDVDRLAITSFRVTPKTVRAGEAFTVRITVTNRGTAVAETQNPPPGTVYARGQSWRSRGFEKVPGRVRVGVAVSGPRGYAFPYRWGLGGPLPPARSRTVTGKIVMDRPGPYSFYAAVFVEGAGYHRSPDMAYGLRVTESGRSRRARRALVTPTRIMVNGDLIDSPQPPLVLRGTVFVPIRFPSEHMGARVRWDNRLKRAEIDKAGRHVRLRIGHLNAWVNGNLVTLYQRPFIRHARTYVPLRFVSESLGARVSWDGPTRTVRIQT